MFPVYSSLSARNCTASHSETQNSMVDIFKNALHNHYRSSRLTRVLGMLCQRSRRFRKSTYIRHLSLVEFELPFNDSFTTLDDIQVTRLTMILFENII